MSALGEMHDPGICFVVGAPGFGKSTLMGRALARDWRRGSTVVTYDPTGDLARNALQYPPLTADEHCVAATEKEAREALKNGRRFVTLFSHNTSDFKQLQQAWLNIAHEMHAGWVYASDESEQLLPNNPIGDDFRKGAIMTIARNRGVRVYLASKVPQRTHIDARLNARLVCVFRADSRQFVQKGCQGFGDPEIFEPAWELPVGKYLFRGHARKSNLEALPKYDALRDPIPFPALLGPLAPR